MENEGSPEANLVQPRQLLFLLALLAGNAALAMGPCLVRLADTGPVSSGFWRLFLALPFLAVFARISGQALTGIPRRTLMFVALGAVAFGLDLASWHVGIEMTRLGNATLFGNAGSIVMLFWGFIVARSLPPLPTAYPRKSSTFEDPEQGLASIEALYAAQWYLGQAKPEWLADYHFREDFLELNPHLAEAPPIVDAPDADAR